MAYGIRPQPGKKVKLGDIDPNMNGGLDREKAKKESSNEQRTRRTAGTSLFGRNA